MPTPQPDSDLTIGALAQRTGCTVPTIRYYEEIGLIPPAKRRPSGHRVYGASAEDLLVFVRQCRDFGFPIEKVRELTLLARSDARDCVETRDIAQTHLNTVRVKLAELRALERSLSGLVKSCSALCIGGPAGQCSITKDLRRTTRSPSAPKPGCCG